MKNRTGIRCYAPHWQTSECEVIIDSDEAHHIQRVLRLHNGDSIELFNGRGLLGRGRFYARERGATVCIDEADRCPPPAVSITLYQAVLKAQRMELLLQKAVELGAGIIQPVICQRSITAEKKEHTARMERWRRIMLNAAKQCKTPWLPVLKEPQTSLELLESDRAVLPAIAGIIEKDTPPLKKVMSALLQQTPLPSQIGLWVGPEGDFTPEEADALKRAHVQPAGFGPQVLRAETAGMFILSALLYELDAMPPT